jgi:hypothetical protein
MTRGIHALVLAAACLAPAAAWGAGPAPLALTRQRLELPGVPVQSFATDFDRDGWRDLVVVVASTRWGQTGYDEPAEIDSGGTLVEALTVVPTLFDRRDLLVYRGRPEGGFAEPPLDLELPDSVHAVEAGPPAAPLVAWTDDGVAEVVAAPSGGLELAARVRAPTLFAGSRSYLPRLGLVHDLDGDGTPDLLVPLAHGLGVVLTGADGLPAEPTATLPVPLEERLPGDANLYRDGPVRQVPLPVVQDFDGDGLPDLAFRNHDRGWNQFRICFNRGGGRFGPPVDPLAGRARDAEPEVVWVGDLDGDGRAELVTAKQIENGKDSLRAGLAEAKRPRFHLEVHELGPDGVWDPAPRATLELEGYVFADAGDIPVPTAVRDLDGDGRIDLVAVTLDFSLFEAARVMTAKSVKLDLDFAVYRQEPGFVFRRVPGLDLSGQLRLHLDRLALGQLSSFAGDFDGDGRADFLQLGRGRAVSVHLGRPGARYAAAPDLTLELEREPADATLVRVADLDGDGRSDLAITEPVGSADVGRRAALDLYLSRGAAP